MGAHTHEMPVVQHQNLVCLAQGCRALGHEKHRGVPGKRPQGLAQRRVGGEVQRAGAVIQDEDIGLSHQGAGDGQPLALAAGEVPAALLHDLVEPQGLAPDKLGGLGGLQGVPEILVGGVLVAPEEVGADGAGEELGFLEHHAHLLADLLFRPLPGRAAEDGHGAGGGVVEPGDQVHQAGLARAGAADDADGLPGTGGEGDVGEALVTGAVVVKAHMVEDHGLAGLGGGGLGGEGHGHGGVEDGAHPVQAGQRPAGENHGVGQLHKLNEHLAHVVDQRHHVAVQEQPILHLLGAQG